MMWKKIVGFTLVLPPLAFLLWAIYVHAGLLVMGGIGMFCCGVVLLMTEF